MIVAYGYDNFLHFRRNVRLWLFAHDLGDIFRQTPLKNKCEGFHSGAYHSGHYSFLLLLYPLDRWSKVIDLISCLPL